MSISGKYEGLLFAIQAMAALPVKFLPFLLVMISAPALADNFRVGVVNLELIMRESVQAVKAGDKLKKEFSARDQEIKKLSKNMKDLEAFLEKEGVTLPDTERRNKERELANLNVSLQRLQREFSEDLILRQNEELTVVLEHANKAIQAVAENEKYDLVLQEAVFRNPDIDITEKILKYMADEK